MTASTSLSISEVFGPTVQGEGPTAGRRCGFVRLASCNLDCTWCDTRYSWDWHQFDPAEEVTRIEIEDLLTTVSNMHVNRIVITGGEPLLQGYRLLDFLAGCARREWLVEVETNGTVAPTRTLSDLVDQFTVSPKLANSGIPAERRLRPPALHAFAALANSVFKFVVSEPSDLDEVHEIVSSYDLSPIWISPEGTVVEDLQARLRVLAQPVLERGWNLGNRLHIVLWSNERGH